MRVIVLVIDGLGVGEMDDVPAIRKRDINSNTIQHIHQYKSLHKTFYSNVGLLNYKHQISGEIDNKKYITQKCFLPYEGADSTLGHYSIAGAFLGCKNVFLEDIYDDLMELFKSNYNVEYTKGVVSIDDKIFIANNVECDPGLNINVLGRTDVVSYNEILAIGRVVRANVSACRVIIMGGKNLSAQKVYESIDYREREENKIYCGINIPKTGIFGKYYQVTHLAYEDDNLVNMIYQISQDKKPISLIGKIANLFPNYDAYYQEAVQTDDVMDKLENQIQNQGEGLIFANVQELDLAGHAENVEDAYQVLKQVDDRIGSIISELRRDDVFILTADHGNDPCINHSFHTREFVPLVIIGDVNMNIPSQYIPSLCDIGFSVSSLLTGRGTENGINLFCSNM